MLIRVDGNVIKAARITGPTHHFLAIEFSNTQSRYDFKFIRDQASEHQEILLDSVRAALQMEMPVMPIDGRLYIKDIFVDHRDSPNVEAYREIFRSIFLEAKKMRV